MLSVTDERLLDSEDFGEPGSPEEMLTNNQFEALKSLTNLLVREVESLARQKGATHRGISNRGVDLTKELRRFEIGMIRSALIVSGGVQRKAAQLLGLKDSTLSVKIKRYKIDPTELEPADQQLMS